MKVSVTIIGIIFMISITVMADASFGLGSAYSCKAKRVNDPISDSLDTELTFSQSNSGILVTSKSSDKELSFEFGQGKLYGKNVSDKTRFVCEENVNQSPSNYSFEYKCGEFITDVDGTKKQIRSYRAQVNLQQGISISGKVCSLLSADGSRCWTLSKCK